MIPPLDRRGYLPPGVHQATLDEVESRFGSESEIRRVQMESLRWLIDLARRAGVSRVVVNGSFVTSTLEPNDVDCALLVETGFPHDKDTEAELLAGLPFLSIDIVRQEEFKLLIDRFFATDRRSVPKGMVEILL